MEPPPIPPTPPAAAPCAADEDMEWLIISNHQFCGHLPLIEQIKGDVIANNSGSNQLIPMAPLTPDAAVVAAFDAFDEEEVDDPIAEALNLAGGFSNADAERLNNVCPSSIPDADESLFAFTWCTGVVALIWVILMLLPEDEADVTPDCLAFSLSSSSWCFFNVPPLLGEAMADVALPGVL